MKTNVIIRFQVEGFHNFPNALEIYPEVGFLSNRHRHIFHFECKKEVFHDNRDVEFILLKREIISWLYDHFPSKQNFEHEPPFYYFCEFENMSCEMIAKCLVEHFGLNYCSIFEDGENGAEVIV